MDLAAPMPEPICKCPLCRGEGVRVCPRCEGAGAVSGPLGSRLCNRCGGEKRVACDPCNGTGLVAATSRRARAKLAAACGCGKRFSAEEWRELAYVGIQDDGAGGFLELRNCPCKSTIAVELPQDAPRPVGVAAVA